MCVCVCVCGVCYCRVTFSVGHDNAAPGLTLPPLVLVLHLFCTHCTGTRCIILTLGEHGAALVSMPAGGAALLAQHVPAARADAVVSLSGAGDTLTGTFAAAVVQGAQPLHALALGVAAARCAVESARNVPSPVEGLQHTALESVAARLLAGANEWTLPLPLRAAL